MKESNTLSRLEKGSATGSLTTLDEETNYTMKEPKNIRLNFLKREQSLHVFITKTEFNL